MSQFKEVNITKHISRIDMPYVSAYLIKGEKRAVLIDTGWGYGDLKSFVESICELPYEVILSHGHCDHGGGAIQFDEVYLHSDEVKLERYSCSMEVKQKIFRHVLRRDDFEEKESEWLPQREKPFKSFDEKMVLDLGGLTVKPILVPGHSPAIMSFLIPEEGIAIFGDACSEPTLMTTESSTSIQEHYQGLLHLREFEHDFERVLINHSPYELPKEVLSNNIRLVEQILAGEDAQEPIHINGELSYSARERRSKNGIRTRSVGNILYKPQVN